jgi:hypothetical protein
MQQIPSDAFWVAAGLSLIVIGSLIIAAVMVGIGLWRLIKWSDREGYWIELIKKRKAEAAAQAKEERG